MNKYKNLIEKNDLKVNKVTIKNNLTFIETPLGKFVIKDNPGNNIYDYLLSRGFEYFPRIIDMDDEGILFEYIDEVDYDREEKAQDFIKVLALLHAKTSYFKRITPNDNKEIYEKIKNKLLDLNNYYNNLISIIENQEYMSPSEYFLARNISIVFSSINYSNSKIDEWYELVKDSDKKRVSTLYNDINIDTLIKSKNHTYLTSFDNVIVDSPINDLLSFFNRYIYEFDFISLIKVYEKIFPLLNDENILFNSIITIPDKIIVNNNVNNFKNIKKNIDRLYLCLNYLNFKEKETKGTKENKDNEK